MTPLFQLAKASPEVTALIGSNPVRLFEFGDAPQLIEAPYATWQIVAGSPENYLTDPPDVDHLTIQIDVWAQTPSSARAVAQAIRRAIENTALITSWLGESKDAETGLYRFIFKSQFIITR